MARYDESRYGDESVESVKETFAEARRWKEEQAKKEDKFSRRLAIGENLVRGADLLVNNAAEELDRSQAHQRATYSVLLTRANEGKALDKKIRDANQSRLEYLVDKYYKASVTDFENRYGDVDINSLTLQLQEQAQKDAEEDLQEFENYLDSSNEFSMTTVEQLGEYYESYKDTPRSIGSWITGRVKDRMSVETPETLRIKSERTKDAIYGSELYHEFKDFKTDMEIFEKTSRNAPELIAILDKAIQEGRARGNIVGPPQTMTKQEYDADTGLTTSEQFVVITERDPRDATGEPLVTKISLGSKQITATDASIYASTDDITNMIALFKKENKKKVSDLLKAESGDRNVTNRDVQNVLLQMMKDPTQLATDWSLKETQQDLFINYHKNLLLNEGYHIDDKGTEDLDDDVRIQWSHLNTSGDRVLLPQYEERAIAKGITFAQQHNIFLKDPDAYFGVDTSKISAVDAQNRDTIEWINHVKETGSVPIMSMMGGQTLDPQRQALDLLLKDSNSSFHGIFKDDILDPKNPDNKLVGLGEWDLNILFETLDADGKLGLKALIKEFDDTKEYSLFFDKEREELYIRDPDTTVPMRPTLIDPDDTSDQDEWFRFQEAQKFDPDLTFNEWSAQQTPTLTVDNISFDEHQVKGTAGGLSGQARPARTIRRLPDNFIEDALKEMDLTNLSPSELLYLNSLKDEDYEDLLGLTDLNIELRDPYILKSPTRVLSQEEALRLANEYAKTKGFSTWNSFAGGLNQLTPTKVPESFFDELKTTLIELSK